jgi:hypothetical protein
MGMCDLLDASAALLPGKNLFYQLDRSLRGPQSCSGRGGEEQNFQLPTAIEP